MKRSLAVLAVAAAATACSQSDIASISANAVGPAAPVAMATTPAESNAANNAGDIPDTQVFVTYAGPGYSVLVPEGWSRTQRGSAVTFRSNAASEMIDVRPATERIDPRRQFHATGAITVKRGTLGTAPAKISLFRSRGSADPVTGKAVALENEVYTTTRNARTGILILSAPVGADNADQWRKIAASFRWK